MIELKPVKPKLTANGKLDIYFSFWSWKLLKSCAHSYRLTLFENLRAEKREAGNAIQGGVPDKMAEDYFGKPLEWRKQNGLQWFYDNFEHYWNLWQSQKDTWVSWMSDEEMLTVDKLIESGVERKNWPESLKGKHHHRMKKQETIEHIKALVEMINDRNLNDLQVKSQLSFKVQIADGNDYVLSAGGRIDLLFEVTPGVWDIWDMKGVKDPKSNDIDQLIIYKMGMQAQGMVVRNTGFLNMKQKVFDTQPVTAITEAKLRSDMVDMFRKTVAKGTFWPNYRKWACGYCDVRDACSTFQEYGNAKGDLDALLSKGVEPSGRLKF